ncbi:MAG: hypothetical protein H6Q58_2014 [Firmicutes bacterium]|nr:hypothetical protein [Bacillota bacterium]
MIFIGGMSSKQEKLDFGQSILCSVCSRFGTLEVFMEYTYLSLFFIPVMKWNRRYYVRSTCCGSLYSISEEIGERIRRGEHITLSERDLQPLRQGQASFVPRCPRCGYELEGDFRFCPNCGGPLK